MLEWYLVYEIWKIWSIPNSCTICPNGPRSKSIQRFSDCPLAMEAMKQIPSGLPLSCHIKDHCTAIECCLDLQSPLQQTIHFFMDLDLCLQTLNLGIENLTFETTLLSYAYGLIFFYISAYQYLCLKVASDIVFVCYSSLWEKLSASDRFWLKEITYIFTGTQEHFRLADVVQIM